MVDPILSVLIRDDLSWCFSVGEEGAILPMSVSWRMDFAILPFGIIRVIEAGRSHISNSKTGPGLELINGGVSLLKYKDMCHYLTFPPTLFFF